MCGRQNFPFQVCSGEGSLWPLDFQEGYDKLKGSAVRMNQRGFFLPVPKIPNEEVPHSVSIQHSLFLNFKSR